MTPVLFTLGELRDQLPDRAAYANLVAALDTSDRDATLSVGDVAKVCGAEAAIWCLAKTHDRRTVVAAIMPIVSRGSEAAASVNWTNVGSRIAALKTWAEGGHTLDAPAVELALEWRDWTVSRVAEAASANEEETQVRDLITMFPPHALRELTP